MDNLTRYAQVNMSRGENVNPNQQIIKITDPTTGTTKLVN